MAFDAESWGRDLSDLLDQIEFVASEDLVRELCAKRFEIAERHGLEMVLQGEASGEFH